MAGRGGAGPQHPVGSTRAPAVRGARGGGGGAGRARARARANSTSRLDRIPNGVLPCRFMRPTPLLEHGGKSLMRSRFPTLPPFQFRHFHLERMIDFSFLRSGIVPLSETFFSEMVMMAVVCRANNNPAGHMGQSLLRYASTTRPFISAYNDVSPMDSRCGLIGAVLHAVLGNNYA